MKSVHILHLCYWYCYISWNYSVNEGIVGKISCGIKNLRITSQFGKLRRQHNTPMEHLYIGPSSDLFIAVLLDSQ